MESEERQLIDVMADGGRVAYVVFDPENRASVENLVTEIPTLKEALFRVQAEAPDLLAMDEGALKEVIHKKLTLVMKRIRMSFWQEYENAVQLGRRMKLSQIIGGICTEYHWSTRILTDNEKMAWIFCPPANYTVQVKEALQAGMETIREIVSAKVIDEDGFLIPRAADVVLKAVALLDMRVKGAIVQRIDQRTLSMNVNQNISGKDAPQLPASMDELDSLIAQTKAKLTQINQAPVRELQAPMTHDQMLAEREAIEVPVHGSAANGKRIG